MRLIFFIFLSICCLSIPAQIDSTSAYRVGANLGHGFVIPHSPIINFLAQRSISQNEVYFESNRFKKGTWHESHNFPAIGVLLSRFNLNNPTNIGAVYSLSPYAKFNLIQGKRANLKIRTSLGLGYIEKPFHSEENFKNTAIGSKINMFISLQLAGELVLYRNLGLNYGLGFSHLSNTGFKTPNLGFNMATIHSGLSYKFGETVSIKKELNTSFKSQKAYWYVNAGLGLNELNPPGGKKYMAKALFVKREKRIRPNSSIGAGLDFFYNPAHIIFLRSEGTELTPIENVQIAISVSHLLHFGKLDFTSQLSYYVKNKNAELGSIYHIFGGRWNFNSTYSAFFLGKTHISKAEYVMVGIGIKLGNEK